MINKQELPNKISIFPLDNFIIFPKTSVPLNIFEPRYIEMVNDALASYDRLIAMIQPIESSSSQELIQSFPKKQQNMDTVYLYMNGKSYTRSSAAIRCLLFLKWYWKIWFPFVWIVPLPLRNFVYKVIAKYRHRIFSKPEVCSFQID